MGQPTYHDGKAESDYHFRGYFMIILNKFFSNLSPDKLQVNSVIFMEIHKMIKNKGTL